MFAVRIYVHYTNIFVIAGQGTVPRLSVFSQGLGRIFYTALFIFLSRGSRVWS